MKSLTFFTFALLLMMIFHVNAVALTWDFEKQAQLDNWKAINGTWEIEKGQLKGTLGPDYMGIVCIFEGSEDWADYTFEAKTTVAEGKYTYWMARVQPDPLSYYAFERSHSNSATIWRRDKGQHAKLMAGPALQPGHLETHLWKMEVKGDQISVFLDDKLLVEATDNTYKKGTIGFGGHNMDSATGKNVILFDDVSVNGPGIPASLSVSPRGKLALTWGEMKK
ncbi:hypothetical protein FJZ31_39640 [Candidatus Poribacteria bacterium]|nr:hypothetical protein [Candidatus Poribacteria bacterium]